jgi:hypothetical protein
MKTKSIKITTIVHIFQASDLGVNVNVFSPVMFIVGVLAHCSSSEKDLQSNADADAVTPSLMSIAEPAIR